MKSISLKSNQDYKIWFISDLHCGHDKPFILGPRKYKTVDEAYAHTFQMLQDHIGPDDIVFNLGDAVVGAQHKTMEYAKRVVHLPCRQQYYIWGNHNAGMQNLYDDCRVDLGLLTDDVDIYPLTYPGSNFTFLGHRVEITIDGIPIVLDHYPIASWNHFGKGAYMIHGHCHRNFPEDPSLKRIDISWEWKRRPVEWQELHQELKNRNVKPVDHHGKEEPSTERFFE
jgi:calcineurin-like phosphoesterase family protein